jgi:hypothetical protein
MRPRPLALLLAAAVQAIEAAGLLVVAVLTAMDTAAGRSYHNSSGIALTVIAFGAVLAVAFIAYGLYRVRPWSRTPALFTQLFVGTTGVYLLNGHRLGWGVPALLLGIAGFVGLLVPPSWRALAFRPRFQDPPATSEPAAKVARPAAKVARSEAKVEPTAKVGQPTAKVGQPAGQAGAAAGQASSATRPGARPVPPAASTARPSGKKPSSRRR